MGAYGNPDAAIAGMIVGVPNDVESAIAKEDIAYGSPVYGPVGVENVAYGPHKDKATVTYTSDTQSTSVLTTVINGISVANTFATDHATTMTAHIAAINAKAELVALGITATASTARIFVVQAPAGLDLTVTSAITVAGAATAAITYGTACKFLGAAAFVQNGGKTWGAGTAGWKTGMSVNIVADGTLWVPVESTVADKDPAYAVIGGTGTLGKFNDVSTNNYDIGSFFRSNVDNGLAILEVRGLK